jgi:hypothetical protein
MTEKETIVNELNFKRKKVILMTRRKRTLVQRENIT